MQKTAPVSNSVEKTVRAIFRAHYRKLTKVLLKPSCHRVMHYDIVQRVAILEFFKREARRKKPSKAYLAFCENKMQEAASGFIGPLAHINPQDVAGLKASLDMVIAGLSGKTPRKVDPKSLISLQQNVFLQKNKRGPKPREMYDAAFLRYKREETISSIASALDPEAFKRDPENTLQRFAKR